MNSEEQWAQWRAEAGRHLGPNFAHEVVHRSIQRQVNQANAHRYRLALITALILFIVVNGGCHLHYLYSEQSHLALWQDYLWLHEALASNF